MKKIFTFLVAFLAIAGNAVWGQETITINTAKELREFAKEVNENTDEEGQKTLEKVMKRVQAGVPVIQVFNKCDLKEVHGISEQAIAISAKTGEGIEALKERLMSIVGWENKPESTFLARERHLEALNAAYEHLRLANQFVDCHEPPLDLLAEELRLCNEELGTIIGETTPDDLLGMIFSRFCIGK